VVYQLIKKRIGDLLKKGVGILAHKEDQLIKKGI
jgi:hypothetical protein